jgi:starch synthase
MPDHAADDRPADRLIRALSVVSEVFPLIKTGGLADVAGALPAALAPLDVALHTLVPGYPAVLAALGEAETVFSRELFGGPARVLAGTASGLPLFAIDAPHLYARPGNPYSAPDGGEWPDNPLRFAGLARIAADIGLGAVPGFVPDIVHAHDWQAGLAPAYLHYEGAGRRPGTVMTIHNLAFQGQIPASLLGTLGLPPHSYTIDGVEYYGAIGMLKAGVALADRITTVSPTYAAEIRTPAGGMGLGGLLAARAGVLTGIANGIDTAVWNPAIDPLIAATFDTKRLAKRPANKVALAARLGLDCGPERLLFGVVSRLSEQKGIDLVLAALPTLLGQDACLAVLGAGDPGLRDGLLAAAATWPGRVGVIAGYDEALAHLMQAGCDALLVPSRFEPCGLTQLCALHYGAVPVVSRVGGLADTVIDANLAALSAGVATGIQFEPVTTDALAAAITRAARLWTDRTAWRTMQLNGLRAAVDWSGPARTYAALYRQLSQRAG